MVDQVHGIKLENIEPVIKRPMSKRDIIDFRNILVQSYNPDNKLDGVKKEDISVAEDADYLYFRLKTSRKDTEGRTIFRCVFKYRKFKENGEKKT